MHKRISTFGLILLASVLVSQPALAQHHHHHGHHHHHHHGHHHHGGSWGGSYYAPGYGNAGWGAAYYHRGHYHYCGPGYGYGSGWLTPIVQTPNAGQWNTASVNSAPTSLQQQVGGSTLPSPTFGAYTQVPRVAADLAFYANTLCLTIHRSFQTRPDYTPTYRLAYALLQRAKSIRELSATAANREEIARQLPLIDEDMHILVGGLESWVGSPSNSVAADIATLKQDVAQLGNALHYLMVDVGVPHRDPTPRPASDPEIAAPTAPAPVRPR